MQNGPFFPQNGQFFPQNALFIHFSYEFCTFLIHSKFHSIVQQKYSFKKISDYSFNKNIHFLKKCRIVDPLLEAEFCNYEESID